MGKLWGLTLLALCACTAPVKLLTPVALEHIVGRTANQLDAVAELRAGVERAAQARGTLARARNPVTGWMTDGAMALIARDLEARRHDLRRRGASRLVRVSMTTDVDPALDQLLRDLEEQ